MARRRARDLNSARTESKAALDQDQLNVGGRQTMATQPELQVQQKREVEQKQERTIPARQFLPVTDIFETDHALTLVVEMPGVKKENVDVRVENDVLTIDGRVDFSNYEGLQPLYTEYNVG